MFSARYRRFANSERGRPARGSGPQAATVCRRKSYNDNSDNIVYFTNIRLYFSKPLYEYFVQFRQKFVRFFIPSPPARNLLKTPPWITYRGLFSIK